MDDRWKADPKHQIRTAGRYDKHLAAAKARAKATWGAGWPLLTQDMQTAYICKELCGLIAGIDFRAALEGHTDIEDAAVMLDGVGDVCIAALK